jgi:Fur family ferric uptake transcriptional regulator
MPAPAPSERDEASRIERLCIARGLKMTGQRRLIARVLSDSDDHPDVEELYRRATALDARISIATVYRTVRLLEEQGILERRDFGGGRARYDQADRGQHDHLIDIDTGKVEEFADPRQAELAAEIAARLGFQLVGHRLELFGRRFAPETTTARPPRRRTTAAAAGLNPGPQASSAMERGPALAAPNAAGDHAKPLPGPGGRPAGPAPGAAEDGPPATRPGGGSRRPTMRAPLPREAGG